MELRGWQPNTVEGRAPLFKQLTPEPGRKRRLMLFFFVRNSLPDYRDTRNDSGTKPRPKTQSGTGDRLAFLIFELRS